MYTMVNTIACYMCIKYGDYNKVQQGSTLWQLQQSTIGVYTIVNTIEYNLGVHYGEYNRVQQGCIL